MGNYERKNLYRAGATVYREIIFAFYIESKVQLIS